MSAEVWGDGLVFDEPEKTEWEDLPSPEEVWDRLMDIEAEKRQAILDAEQLAGHRKALIGFAPGVDEESIESRRLEALSAAERLASFEASAYAEDAAISAHISDSEETEFIAAVVDLRYALPQILKRMSEEVAREVPITTTATNVRSFLLAMRMASQALSQDFIVDWNTQVVRITSESDIEELVRLAVPIN